MRPGSSRPSGRRSAATAAPSPASGRTTSPPPSCAAVVDRAGIDPALVEDVILGCANQAGEDNRDVARMALLLAGLPGRGRWPDRQPAVRLRAPGDQLGRARDRGRRRRRVHRRRRRIDDPGAVRPAQGRAAVRPRHPRDGRHDPRLAVRQPAPGRAPLPVLDGRDRRERRRALGRLARAPGRVRAREPAARRRGHRGRPVRRPDRPDLGPAAEGRAARRRPRRASRAPTRPLEALGRLKPGLPTEGGTVTAGNSSGINDGASAVLLVEADRARELGLRPLARVVVDGGRRRRPGGHGRRARARRRARRSSAPGSASRTSTSSSSTRRSRRSRSSASTSSASIRPRST